MQLRAAARRDVIRFVDSYASLLVLLLANFFLLELVDDPRWGAIGSTLLADLARKGNPRHAFQEMFTEATQRWIDGGDGYTESFHDFCERSDAAVRRTAERLGKGETALVFTSGGPISVVVSRLLSGGDALWAKLNPVTINTAITKVVSGRSGLTMVSYNEHGHLDGTDLLSYR